MSTSDEAHVTNLMEAFAKDCVKNDVGRVVDDVRWAKVPIAGEGIGNIFSIARIRASAGEDLEDISD